jgi:hypothetical protein
VLMMRQFRCPIAACVRPAAATADAINRRWPPLLLATSLLAAALSLILAAPTHAEGLEEPGCRPWVCRPSTAGIAVLEGVIERSPNAITNFEPSHARFVYRTAEHRREADGTYSAPRFGTSHVVKLTEATNASGESTGTFKISLPACNPTARVFGCMGGEYEGYATYNGTPCSEYNVYVMMTVGEVNQIPANSLACIPPKPSKHKHKKRTQTKHRR